MNPRTLTALAVVLGLANVVAAIVTGIEHVPNSEPVMLALFVIPWLAGAELLRRGRLTAGAIVVGLLSVLDVVSFPGWKRTSALDWATQSVTAALAAVSLAIAVAVLVRRHRSPLVAGAVR
jgi:hypothetical protein